MARARRLRPACSPTPLRFAFREEVTRRPSRVGSEHILLGLMHADQEALVDFGVEADGVREEMHRVVALTADESSTGEV